MKRLGTIAPCAAIFLLAISSQAQNANVWDKSYPITAQPTLGVTTGDSNLEIKSCGECKSVRIHVDAQNRKLSDYVLDESQTGNIIHFSLKQKPRAGIHFSIHGDNSRSVAVSVETPTALTLHAETADGDLTASGLSGAISLRSEDGHQNIADVSGTINVQSSDGAVQLRSISGTLDARTSDGNLDISGRLDGVNVRTSDGNVVLELASGSTLKAASMLHSSDGTVTVRMPKNLAANFDVSTSDGKIDCNLPLTLDGFHSLGSSDHSVRGKLNGGGATFTIHTSDGAVRLSSL